MPALLYKMYCRIVMKMHVVIVQIQSTQNTYETSVVTWEPSTSDSSSYYNTAKLLRYMQKNQITPYYHLLAPVGTHPVAQGLAQLIHN